MPPRTRAVTREEAVDRAPSTEESAQSTIPVQRGRGRGRPRGRDRGRGRARGIRTPRQGEQTNVSNRVSEERVEPPQEPHDRTADMIAGIHRSLETLAGFIVEQGRRGGQPPDNAPEEQELERTAKQEEKLTGIEVSLPQFLKL